MRVRKIAKRLAGASLGALLLVIALGSPASAIAAPAVEVDTERFFYDGSDNPTPTSKAVPVGTYAHYFVGVTNTGDEPTTEEVTVTMSVPADLKITDTTDEIAEFLPEVGSLWDCVIAPGGQSVSCSGPKFEGSPIPILPGQEVCEAFGLACRLHITMGVDSEAALGEVAPTVTVCGGGVTTCPTVAATAPSDPFHIAPYVFEATAFDGENLKQNGEAATEAGSHPHSAAVDITFSDYVTRHGEPLPTDELRDAAVKFPPGLLANPQAYPTCTQKQLANAGVIECPADSQIGMAELRPGGGLAAFAFVTPLYNVEVPQGLPALFGFNIVGNVTEIYAEVRTGDDYGVNLTAKNNPQAIPIAGSRFEFWGVPADPSHDSERRGAGCLIGCPSGISPPSPFVTQPTSCLGPVETGLDLISWKENEASSSFLSHAPGEPFNPVGGDGCNTVEFDPTLQARPTTNVADAASGLDLTLHIPQNEDANGSATAHLKEVTVTLPEGLVLNPSAGNGLAGCSTAEIDLNGAEPDQCPDASKLGTVEISSPLVDKPLPGGVFLAEPYANPFNSLLALYIAVDDPQTGMVVKLAGEVTSDPATGRLSATFADNPQLPFEDLELHLFGGAGGALRTPAVCGDYTANSSLVPWTTPDGATVTRSDTWAITQGPNGGACAGSEAAKPHAPSFDAGTVSPIAGAHSPLAVSLRREDGSQEFSQVTVTPPPGLIGKLAGIPYCPEEALAAAAGRSGNEEKASPSCPAASQVGIVDVAAGAGPAPYHAQGTAYLTAPYNGAPLGLAIVTPATAGPFDLGTVVTRVALHINPVNAQITANADPLPTILEGIPLDVRAVRIFLERPEFTLNPTSCDPMAFTGQLVSTLGPSAALSNRFQLGECDALGLRPKLSLRLSGATKRRGHPSLTATLEPGAGVANLKSVSVALPPTQLLDQRNIGTVCTRVQFAADQCPAGSVYGSATVITPLLDYPLTGNVYLRASDNKLPDLVPDLRGPAHQPIRLEAAGRTDTVKGALRNTFEAIPDAPFTKVVLTLPGGRRGLIQNSANVCAKPLRATVKYIAQNGYTLTQKPKLQAKCPKKRKRKARRKSQRRHRAAVRQLRAVR